LVAVFGALSPHPKIPFPAAVIEREVGPLCLSEIKLAHTDDEVRQEMA
jgi:hypothetical protein